MMDPMIKLRETNILNIVVSVIGLLCHYDNFVIDTFMNKFISVVVLSYV